MKMFVGRKVVDFAPGENTYGLGVVVETWRDEKASRIDIHWKYALPDSVPIMGLTLDGGVVAIEEERPGVGLYVHLVGETIDGETYPIPVHRIIAHAARGLLEETGYAGDLKLLSSIFENSGKSDRLIHTVLATNCSKVGAPEEGITVKLMKPAEFFRTMVAYFRANPASPHGGGNTLKLMMLAFEELGLITIKEG